MEEQVLPESTTPIGQRVRWRLREEVVVWLTTVGRDGTPYPNPVWFWWDGERVHTYNLSTAGRVRHVRERPNVALHFDGDGTGGDIVVITGVAEIVDDAPPSHEVSEYVAKYGERMTRMFGSPEGFSERYPVAVHIHPRRVRAF